MMLIKRCKKGAAIIFALFSFLPVAQAEQSFDCTQCVSSTHTILSVTEELTVRSGDAKGIIMSNLDNKVFDNMTTHCLNLSSINVRTGQMTGLGYSKFMDPDGDYVILETTIALGQSEGNFRFLQGTGKWKGIKGGGKVRAITGGKPITPGTNQVCNRWTGSLELPK